ncbi:MAG TPA: hypothetical protein VNJ01_01070 [Bacteriovoracaceae bacterium]|nr:hypothetical protein [Bacteriovoracaceae bacterium]
MHKRFGGFLLLAVAVTGHAAPCDSKFNRPIEDQINRRIHEGLVRGQAAIEACSSKNEPIVRYFVNTKVDCNKEPAFYRYTLALGLKGVRTSSDSVEKISKNLNVDSALSEINDSLCFESAQRSFLSDASLPESCSISAASRPSLAAGAESSSKGVQVLIQLENIIRGKASCESKTAAIRSLLSVKLSNLDDMVVLSYVASNIEELSRDPVKRQLIGAILEAGLAVPLGHSEDVSPKFSKLDPMSSQMHLSSAAIELRLALIAVEKSAFDASGVAPKADIMKVKSAQQRSEIVARALEGFTLVMANSHERVRISREFRKECDQKVARIFGDGSSVAAVSGFDYVNPNGGKGIIRSHTYINAHFYPNMQGIGTGPFYAPKGFSGSVVPGGMALTQGSYNLSYPNGFGDLKGRFILNMNHLGTPKTGQNLGSNTSRALVGTLAGVGGVSAGSNYNHSHIQLLNGSGHRANLVDAFCRSDVE